MLYRKLNQKMKINKWIGDIIGLYQKSLNTFLLLLRRVNPSVPIFVNFSEPTDLPVGARIIKTEFTFDIPSLIFRSLLIISIYFTLFLLPLTIFSQVNYKVYPDVVYGHKAGMALTYDVFQPVDSANGAGIIHVVSGGWNSRYNPPDSVVNNYKPFLDAGFTVFALRHGSNPQFKIPEMVEDINQGARAIHDHAAGFGVDSARIGIFGASSGGQLALMAGLSGVRHPVGAIVAFFPPADLRGIPDFLKAMMPALDLDSVQAAGISPVLFASPDDPPTLLIHGDRDYVVPLWQSEKMYDALQENKVDSRLIVYKGMMHGNSYGPVGRYHEDATREMIDWFKNHLLKKNNKETQ